MFSVMSSHSIIIEFEGTSIKSKTLTCTKKAPTYLFSKKSSGRDRSAKAEEELS